ncbi:MAG: biotin/lipoyl-binding protein [Bacteroidales bacterium]|nr:biotin/lipoyl-binding protein [Bacteroidales bacterium]
MKTYKFKINGKEYSVDINGIEGTNASVSVNGVAYDVELENEVPAAVSASGSVAPASAPAQPSAPVAAAAPVSVNGGAGTVVKSPLPGVIISIDVKEGQAVKKGQKVAVLEAMKMENEIQADADGTVTAILVSKGDSVLEGAEILKIA